MIKLLFIFAIFSLCIGCSFNKNSKFWTSEKIKFEKSEEYKEIFPKGGSIDKELNSGLTINFTSKTFTKNTENNYSNNNGRLNYNGNLKKSSRYKFSKIENFHLYEPDISFHGNNLIFFDNKGSILKFNENSRLIWKKNYYSKTDKKLNPILQLVNNEKFLIVADNIAKSYMLDLETGELIWLKKNIAPFNSQIKIYKEKFFIIDFSNTLRCFSIKNGKELWNVKTEKSLIRSQKKLSMVIIKDKIYFNNSIGDITAVDINEGELLWQLPTQSSLIYESAFSLEMSDLISDEKNIFFSNNKNQFFSIDTDSGSFNWENKINSNLRPSLIGNYLFTVSLEGYLIVIDKNNGNIIRVTDIFKNFKTKKRKEIRPSGFVIGLKNLYLSTSNGRLIVIDTASGKIKSIFKIDNEKISRPIILDQNLYLIKDNAIIKLN